MSSPIDIKDRFEAVSRVLALSSSARDFCENLVHDETLGEYIHGAAIYEFDGRQNLTVLDSYGQGADSLETKVDLWGHTEIAKITRDKKPETVDDDEAPKGYFLRTIPIGTKGAPSGALVIIVTDKYTVDDDDEDVGIATGMLLGNMMRLWRTNAVRKQDRNEPMSVEDLTTRQLKILNHIAEGMTNSEISRQVLLSESSVRQETIKIYRALGVGGRKEAMIRGRELGIIPSATDSAVNTSSPPPTN
jgi:DNA-binding CsgD family transcriptional regulator